MCESNGADEDLQPGFSCAGSLLVGDAMSVGLLEGFAVALEIRVAMAWSLGDMCGVGKGFDGERRSEILVLLEDEGMEGREERLSKGMTRMGSWRSSGTG